MPRQLKTKQKQSTEICPNVLRVPKLKLSRPAGRDLFKLLIHIIFLFSEPLQCDEGLSTS